MFAKIIKDTQGNILSAFYIYGNNADSGILQGTLVEDQIIANMIRDDSASVIDNYFWDNDAGVPGVYPKATNLATISGQTISNIHNPSRLICAELGVDEEITEGEVVLNIDTPGTYQFTVRSVPFLDKTLEVIV
jgi:hypothetical protein